MTRADLGVWCLATAVLGAALMAWAIGAMPWTWVLLVWAYWVMVWDRTAPYELDARSWTHSPTGGTQ